MAQTETIDNDVCRMLCSLAADYGVRDVIVSPGTRSAPLAVVFSRSAHFRIHTVIDERCAAFMALGMSLATGQPVVLICTSGSALMNYGPALAEAYYRRVPVIAITADRPARWIDQLDSQTMRQPGALAAVVRKWVDIPVAADTDAALFTKANLEVCDAFDAALGNRRGPVHINVQLDIPLTPMTDKEPVNKARLIKAIRPLGSPGDFDEIIGKIRDKKIVIVCGDTTPCECAALNSIDLRGIPVLAEVQANIVHSYRIGTFDRLLRAACADGLEPDIVIAMGGSIVSARLKRWLRTSANTEVFTLGHTDNSTDTYKRLTTRIECDPLPFLQALATAVTETEYSRRWQSFAEESQLKNENFVKTNPIMAALGKIADRFRGDIHVGNGSAIRYAQMLRWNGPVYCNRGISGIDGCTSTALGYALAGGSPTLLITGDMSAAYDIGALGAAVPPHGFRIVVLDNDGGDIFRNIGTTGGLPELEQLFTVPPRLPLRQLADAYGYRYFEYSCQQPDDSVIGDFLNPEGSPAIMRLKIQKEYSKHLL